MYRCYCKLKKELQELEKKLKENYMGDSTLAQKIIDLKNELDINTANDEALQDKVETIENSSSANIQPSSTGAIDSLFP